MKQVWMCNVSDCEAPRDRERLYCVVHQSNIDSWTKRSKPIDPEALMKRAVEIMKRQNEASPA